jgi:hypothetical protein
MGEVALGADVHLALNIEHFSFGICGAQGVVRNWVTHLEFDPGCLYAGVRRSLRS